MVITATALGIWAIVGLAVFMIFAPNRAPRADKALCWLFLGGPLLWLTGIIAAAMYAYERGKDS